MAVKHRIKTFAGDGLGGWMVKEIDVRLSPLQAIRRFCLECCAWQPSEVEECTAPLCPNFPFRLGKDPSKKGKKPWARKNAELARQQRKKIIEA